MLPNEVPDLTSLSAAQALAGFRSGDLSPVALMEAVVARAESVNPAINALTHQRFDQALVEAEQSAERYANGGVTVGPLDGIPVVIKEDEPVAGQPWTQGSRAYRDFVAPHSSTFVERILGAGAVVHARSTAPEFSSAAFTDSDLWGLTRNPWNLAYSAGGSSGGSGAALAAGLTVLATGSDLAGSIRTPSSFNGIVGFKPPHGRVPVDPPFNLDRFCHCGPMARTVEDCLLFQRVLAGPSSTDAASWIAPVDLPDAPGTSDLRGLRIALVPVLGDWPIDAEIVTNTLRMGETLRGLGAVVEEIDVNLSRGDVFKAAAIHYDTVFSQLLSSEVEANPDMTTDYVPEFARWAKSARGNASFLDGLALEAELFRAFAPVFDRFDAIVTPGVVSRGFVAGDRFVGHGLEVGGETLDFYLESISGVLFNILSQCPVLMLPSGFADNGVPTGAQIVSRPYDDATPFRIGLALEAAGGLAIGSPDISRFSG